MTENKVVKQLKKEIRQAKFIAKFKEKEKQRNTRIRDIQNENINIRKKIE